MSEDAFRPAISQAAPPPSTAEPVTARRAAPPPSPVPLRGALLLALAGLGITLWHLVWPSPLAFTAFMIVGQGAFGLALALYGWIIIRDLRRRRAL